MVNQKLSIIKNKFVKQFSSFEEFKKAVRFDEFRKYKDNLDKTKKLLYPYATEQESIIFAEAFNAITQDDLHKLYDQHFSFCGKFYKMEKYKSHRDARGYNVYLWRTGRTYYANNFKPEISRLAYCLEKTAKRAMTPKEQIQTYRYCEVVFYKGWSGDIYRYFIDNGKLKVGDLVVAPPRNNVAEIKAILTYDSLDDIPSGLQTDMPAITTLATEEQIAKRDELQRWKDESAERLRKALDEPNHDYREKTTQYCRVVYDDVPNAKRYCYEVSESVILLQIGEYVYSPNGKKVKVVEVFRSEEAPKDLKNTYKIIRRFR